MARVQKNSMYVCNLEKHTPRHTTKYLQLRCLNAEWFDECPVGFFTKTSLMLTSHYLITGTVVLIRKIS